MMRKFYLLLILIFIIGCNITGKTIQEIPKETTKDPIVYFCPKDNCEQHLINFINSANSYIYCAFFDLRLEDVIKKLGDKSNNVDVKLVIDNNNNKGQIKGKGVVFDTNKQLTHNKFCVIDDRKIWTGSFNPTERGANKNNNNAIAIYSKYLAKNYKDEFNELWNKNFGSGNKVEYPIIYLNNKKIENYFCPEDNCEQHVINEINKAEKSIYFMTFSFTSEEIADAILFKDNIDIKGVFDKTQAGSQYSQYNRLKDFNINVKKDTNPAFMHHKVFIIDNKTVITGSYNPTGSGNYKNDENIIIINDKTIAIEYLKEFYSIWPN